MKPNDPRRIDAHAHAWPEEDMPSIRRHSAQYDSGSHDPGDNNWTPCFEPRLESLVQVEREAGFDRFVLLSVSSRPERCRELTEWVARAAEAHPEIIPFGAVHPYTTSPEDDLDRILGLGLKAVKLHSLTQLFDPRDPRSERLYGLLAEAGLGLLMDSMSLDGAVAAKPNLGPLMDLARQAGVETRAEDIARIARNHPRLRIIAAHLGCCYGWDQVECLADRRNVSFDLAYIHPLIPRERVLDLIRGLGPDRIVFGSDAPYRWPAEALDWLENLPLTPEEQSDILGGNFLRFMGAD
jgi:predicted TIM-barrel fold metal-dependent hydrolase